MREATKRTIFRWIHIVFAIPIIGLTDFGCGKAISFADSLRKIGPARCRQITA